MEKGEPLAELEAGGGAICQGKASAEPIPQFCCGNLPKQASACAPRQGGAWLDGGWAKIALHYSHPEEKQNPGSFPASGCSSICPTAGALDLPPHAASNLTLLTHSPRSKSQEQAGGPLPRRFRSIIAFRSLPPVSKTQPPNPESYFPTLRKEGMPTHRKASVAQSHPGRKPRWEAVGHLLVKEETRSWAPWTRPTLGCISHLHTTNLAAAAVQTSIQGWLCSAPSLTSQPLAAEAGGGQEPGWSLFSPSGDHRAIASLVTSLCFHFLGTN